METLQLEDQIQETKEVGSMRIRMQKGTGQFSSSAATNRSSSMDREPSALYGCFMKDNVRRVDFVLVYSNEEEEDHGGVKSKSKHRMLKFFLSNLVKDGIELETERVKEGKEDLTFVKIHTPWSLLSKHAEELQIKMPLWVHDERHGDDDDEEKSKTCIGRIKSFLCCRDQKSKIFDPETMIFWPFERRHITQFAIIDKEKFFVDRQRIEVTWEIMQKVQIDPDDPKRRGVEFLIENGILEDAFPLHEGSEKAPKGTPPSMMTQRQKLISEWASWGSILRAQPLHDIRNYFGEKIGFYFAFMDFYLKSLIIPSILGLIILINGFVQSATDQEVHNICDHPHVGEEGSAPISLVEGEHQHSVAQSNHNPYYVADYWMCPICAPPNCEATRLYHEFCSQYVWSWRLDNEGTLALSCLTCLWSILFMKFWRRREAALATEWSTQDAEEYDLVIRPDYEKRAMRMRKNPVTSETEPFITKKRLAMWYCISSLATFLLLCLATACLAVLVISRIALYSAFKKVGGYIGEKNVEFARWTVHGLIFIMVSVFEKLYHSVAHKLTRYECPKTDSQFMSSLLWKIFIFELLNDFVPIGYAAWLKGKTIRTPLELNFFSELCDGGCMGEVTELVAVLLLARLVVGNVLEVGVPAVTAAIKKCRTKNAIKDEKAEPQWKVDLHLNEAELDGVYDQYMEMMVQFTFIVLFIPAFPVAAAICFLNNVVEIRVDAFNIMLANRRPLPIRVPGIQIWNQFLDIIVKLGVVFNGALIAFTSDSIAYLYYMYSEAPNSDGVGYTKFTLSSVDVHGWDHHLIEHMIENNITHCYYSDFRFHYEPYSYKQVYWQIFTLRAAVFSAYCLVFFIIMWLVNTFIADIPNSVKTKVKRKNFVVHKAREAEAALAFTKWAEKNETSSTASSGL